MLNEAFILFHNCWAWGFKSIIPKESSIAFFARSSSSFKPFITWLVISAPKTHTVHLSIGTGSCLVTLRFILKSGKTLTVFVKLIFTFLSPSSNPQRQAGVHGVTTVLPMQTLVDPIIL